MGEVTISQVFCPKSSWSFSSSSPRLFIPYGGITSFEINFYKSMNIFYFTEIYDFIGHFDYSFNKYQKILKALVIKRIFVFNSKQQTEESVCFIIIIIIIVECNYRHLAEI